MKKFKIIKEFDCAFGNLFPVGTIILAEINESFVHFGEISEVESGKPPVIGTGLQNFLNHTQPVK